MNIAIERIRLETRIRILTIAAITDITPLMRRIRLAGPELEGFRSPGHADHVKVFIPADGKPIPRPTLTPEGIAFDDSVPKPFMRDYTPRYFDPEALTLDLDFVLHGEGSPASGWAARAQVGDEVMIGGPRGSIIVPDAFDWYFFAGDETALPAIGRGIEELPKGRKVIAVIEVADKAEEQVIETAADLELHWVHRNGKAPGAENLIEPYAAGLTFPSQGEGFAFVAGEARMSKSMRVFLTQQRGIDNDYVRAPGYWVREEGGEH